MNKKRVILCSLLVAFFVFAGCGKKQVPDSTTLVIDKKDKITQTLVESFDKDYYKEEELKATIEDQINRFQEERGKDAVTLKSLKVKNEKAILTMEYNNGKEYGAFNQETFFLGSIHDGIEKGDLDPKLSLNSIEKGKVLEDEKYKHETLEELSKEKDLKVLFFQNTGMIEVPKNIIAISPHVELVDKKKAKLKEKDSEEESTNIPETYGYIIYKK